MIGRVKQINLTFEPIRARHGHPGERAEHHGLLVSGPAMYRLTQKLIKRGVAKLVRRDVVPSGNECRTQLLCVVTNPIELMAC